MIIVIIGAQWGDEGKGKVVDLLADRFDIVSRYQGSHNAGHSVYVGDKAFVLRLLPSGIIRAHNVIGGKPDDKRHEDTRSFVYALVLRPATNLNSRGCH